MLRGFLTQSARSVKRRANFFAFLPVIFSCSIKMYNYVTLALLLYVSMLASHLKNDKGHSFPISFKWREQSQRSVVVPLV